MTSVEYLASPFKDQVKAWLSDLRASNVNYLVTSTKRSFEEQRKLYLSRQGCTGCLPAAPPGHSKHELGLAIDIVFDETRGGDLTAQDIIAMADEYGLYMPLPSADPVHWESRTTELAAPTSRLASYLEDPTQDLPLAAQIFVPAQISYPPVFTTMAPAATGLKALWAWLTKKF